MRLMYRIFPLNFCINLSIFVTFIQRTFDHTQHFFVNAKYGSFATQASGSEMVGFLVSEANAIGVGYAFEGLQSRGIGGGKESFLSYEDIRSNIQGGAVGAFINSESSATCGCFLSVFTSFIASGGTGTFLSMSIWYRR